MDTGAIVSVTVQDASDGDTTTLPATLITAAEQVELVQRDGRGVEELVADKGYHSDETLVALGEVGVRSYVSEPERGRRCWKDKKTGETPPEKRAAQRALYANRRRVGGRRGRRLQRCRGEVVERTFAHMYETGGMRRVWVRGHDNVRKRVLIQAAACNIGLLLRQQSGVGTARSLQGRADSSIFRLIGRLIDRWWRLRRLWGFKWTPTALVGSIAHRRVDCTADSAKRLLPRAVSAPQIITVPSWEPRHAARGPLEQPPTSGAGRATSSRTFSTRRPVQRK